MIQRKFKIKDGVLYETTEVRIVDRTKLFKYNPNLRMLTEDIRRSRKDEHFENYLLKAEELFAEDVDKAKVVKDPVLGNHSIFYYMYGHMTDWVRYAEKEVICAKAMLVQAIHIEETIQIIRQSRDIEDATNKLMDVLNLDEVGAKYVANKRISILTGIRPEQHKESILYFEKRLSNVKELAKYDK
ncbi:hypothetical protein [Xylanibacter brevis]|uniref:hypothetical protein n=1 Tax=Xylanibacter brevis TaxID=83231 RepID=UPI0004878327|nr:hypothetical protein [Xylanibacter brevis]